MSAILKKRLPASKRDTNLGFTPQKRWRNLFAQRVMMWALAVPFLCAGLFMPSTIWAAPFPAAGVDRNITSLGKFSIRLTKEMGVLWGKGNACPGDLSNPNDPCVIHSPGLEDINTLIGRSKRHTDDSDPFSIDQMGALIKCDAGMSGCLPSEFLSSPVKDSDFTFVPNNVFQEGPNGTGEVHTQILSFHLKVPKQCTDASTWMSPPSATAVRAGFAAPDQPRSIGEVESLSGSDDDDKFFPAESFFNVFVEVDIDFDPDGPGPAIPDNVPDITLFNKNPLVIQNGDLNDLPPTVVYIHGGSDFAPLVYDKKTGEPVGWLTLAGHGIGYDCQGPQGPFQFDNIYNQLKENTNLEPLPSSDVCSDKPATYSNDTRQAFLPCVDIPLYTDVEGSPIEFTGLYSAIMEIPFGFSDFEAKKLTFLEIIETSDPLHAHFNPDTGILDIPRIDVPTIAPLLGEGSVDGPALQCRAILQQSALRAEVLMLKELDCKLP